MTINEFIEWCNEAGLSGDEKLRVFAYGGMRGGKDIENVSVGFDWDRDSIILHPKITLTIHGPRKDYNGEVKPCEHLSTHWRINPDEPHIGRSIEVCNVCGMSRSHWEQGDSGWMNADIDDFPLYPFGKAESEEG